MDKKKFIADIIIKNAYIVTINKQNSLIENGALVIKKDIILAIGKTSDILDKYKSEKIIDAHQKIVMPGFVNAHTHLAMTVFRGMADDIELSKWLYDYVFPAESKCVTPETVEAGTELALAEMIKSGTTCFNDMYYFQDITAQIAKKTGVRGYINEGLLDFEVANSKSPQQGIDYTNMLIEKYKNDDLIKVGVGAHSTYTCSDELLKKAKKIADQNNTILHIHVAETKWEFETICKEKNATPIGYLNNLNVLSDNVVIAHGVWLNDNDIDILSKKGVSVIHNPECNMKISSGVAPLSKLMSKNITVGLGTDGVASNNNLSMIQELHTMSLLHKINSMNPTAIPAQTAVKIATIESAKAIGLSDKIGSLEIGKKADIIFLDKNIINAVPVYNVFSVIAYALYGNEVTDVIINGKEIMRNNKILTLNEENIISKIKLLSKKIANQLF